MKKLISLLLVILVFTGCNLDTGSKAIEGEPLLVKAIGEPSYLFGHDNVNHNIIKIDLDTGLAEIVGPTGFTSGASGMATSEAQVEGPGGVIFAPGTHFGLLRDNDLGLDFIVAVDLLTGTAVKVVETERLISGRGIAFGPDGATLYLIENNQFSTINISTGAVTLIGDTGTYSSVSLELNPDNGLFYSISGYDLITIDPSDGTPALVKEDSGLGACTIARSPDTGVWYSINNTTGELVSVDIVTGDVTAIGSLGDQASSSICGTAFAEQKPLTVIVPLDIKPTSCPNPFNTRSGGVLPLAIIGYELLDVMDINVETIKLLGVSPLRYNYEDVTAPYEPFTGKEEATDCTTAGPDGFLDLTLKFDRQEVLAALVEELGRQPEDGEVIALTLTAELLDGTAIAGEDVIIIRNKGK